MMPRKDRIDAFGATALVGLALLFAINQVSIKFVNAGFQPVFAVGLRSLLATFCLLLWMRLRGLSLAIAPGSSLVGLGLGTLFAVEFLALFLALDHTTVARGTVILYSMPVWLALLAHFLIPGERIGPRKGAGLALAFLGMAGAMLDRGSLPDGTSTLTGDLLALLSALSWATLALLARQAGGRGVSPEMQLLWMVGLSGPLLLAVAPAFGPLLRDPGAVAVAAMVFQVVVVAFFGFLAWFWLLSTYPAAGVASFSFLSPVFGIALGWAILGEPVGPGLLAAGAMVAAGLLLINWPARPVVPPA